MRNICYAKPISGGYSIVGFNVKQYNTPTLPAVCQHSGQPVILLESAHDFLLKVNAKAGIILKNFNTKLSNLWTELVQDVKTAREDWDEAAVNLDSNESIELVSQYLAYNAASQQLAIAGQDTSRSTERVGEMIDGICGRRFAEEAKRAGFELPVQRRRTINTFELLGIMFGDSGLSSVPTGEENEGKMQAAEASVGADV